MSEIQGGINLTRYVEGDRVAIKKMGRKFDGLTGTVLGINEVIKKSESDSGLAFDYSKLHGGALIILLDDGRKDVFHWLQLEPLEPATIDRIYGRQDISRASYDDELNGGGF